MPVVGISFTKIEGNVDTKKLENAQVSVSSAPKITNVVKKDMNVGNLKSVIEMDFEFNVNYDPNVGNIKLSGIVLYHADDLTKIEKAWKDKKTLDEDIAVEVMNIIFRQSLTKAIVISGDLRLPPPIRFPIVQAGSKGAEKK